MRHLLLLLFSLAGGLTLSGIVASLYRLLAKKPQGRAATWAYYGVMLLAGPSVLLENATCSFRKKECTRYAYGFALGLAAYWSFMLGLGLVELGLVF
jgi:hypothetical protein